jgi:hypothetical protein
MRARVREESAEAWGSATPHLSMPHGDVMTIETRERQRGCLGLQGGEPMDLRFPTVWWDNHLDISTMRIYPSTEEDEAGSIELARWSRALIPSTSCNQMNEIREAHQRHGASLHEIQEWEEPFFLLCPLFSPSNQSAARPVLQ